MKRRQFLNTSVLTASSIMGVGLLGLPQWARAAGMAPNRKKLIVIFLRGGADMLSIFPPRVADPLNHPLKNYRGATAEMQKAFLFNAKVGADFNKPALNLPNYPFLFNPELAESQSVFQGSDVAILLHTGSKNETRSHFEQMDFMESGSLSTKTVSGYLARASHYLFQQERSGVALGQKMPYSMRGFDAALINEVSDLRSKFLKGSAANPYLNGNALTREDRLALFAYTQTCEDAGNRVCVMAGNARDSYNQLERETAGTFDNSNSFLHQCELAAKLAQSEFNPPIMTIDYGGWDTHFLQKPTESSSAYANNVKILGKGLAALKAKLGAEWNNTVVAVMSEFGRTVVANPSLGTDHGRGSAMILMGGPIRRNHNSNTVGGWDLSQFEGTASNLALKVKIDFREVMAEILRDHMGVPLAQDVVTQKIDPKVQKVFDALPAFTKRNLVG